VERRRGRSPGTSRVVSDRLLRPLAEVCGQYLVKGRHVYIEGRLQTRKWAGREGEKRTTIEVVANQMQILDRAPKNETVQKRLNHRSPRRPSMKATIPLMSRRARRRIRKSRFRAVPDSAHILLLAGCVDLPYGPTGMSRQLPQVPSGNRRPQRPSVHVRTSDRDQIGITDRLHRNQHYGCFIVELYHDDRTHLGLNKETPGGRVRSAARGRVVSHALLGGLHH